MSDGSCCDLGGADVVMDARVTIDDVLGVMDLVVNARGSLRVATASVFICNEACL
jgi:hypothetical protein